MEMGKLMALALSCGFPEPAAGWFLYFFTIPFMLAPGLLLQGATRVELALDLQPWLSWLRRGELCPSGLGTVRTSSFALRCFPRLARRKNGSLLACWGIWEASGPSTGSSWNGT